MIAISSVQTEEGAIAESHKFAEYYGVPFAVAREKYPMCPFMIVDTVSAMAEERNILYRSDQQEIDDEGIGYSC